MLKNIEMKDLSKDKNDVTHNFKTKYNKFPFFVGDAVTFEVKFNSNICLLKNTKLPTLSSEFITNAAPNIFLDVFYKAFLNSNFSTHKSPVNQTIRSADTSLRELCADYLAEKIVLNFKEYESKYHPLVDEKTLPQRMYTKIKILPKELIETIYEIMCLKNSPLPYQLENFFKENLESKEIECTQAIGQLKN